ncbi:MAG: InlB B-repeat-containing protein, partial [Prevotella sp.]
MNKNNKKLLCLAIVAMFAMVGTVYVAADADQSDATTSFTCAVGYYFGETLAYSTNFGNTNVSASGLPPGLSFNPANGYLDGYPTTAGTYTVVASGSGETTTYSITITSTFTYTVVFNANGGSGGPGTVNYTCSDGAASYITIPSTTPSRSGYTFIGWASAAVAPGPEVYPGNNLSVSGPGTTTFYALWQVVTVTTYTHTLNYNANGGTNAPSTVTITNTSVNYGITVTTLQPTRSGYIYAGWSTSASATTATYSGGSTVTVGANSSVTLYAVWTLEAPSEYTLTLEYDANGGEGAPAAQSTTSATTSHDFIISSTTPTRSGYTFLGWSVNASATTATYVGGDTRAVLATGGAGSGTLILYAVWNEIGLTTISFNANGGEGNIVDMSVLTGNSINLPTFGFTKDGYYLSSWALGSATGTTYSLGSSYSVTGTVTFYAKWTAIPSDNDLMAPTIAPVGTLYRYIPEAEDNVWTVIKETITSGSIQSSSFPTWMTTHTITYNTLEFAGTPTSSDIGVHIVSLTVRASNGYTCSVSWIVTVSDPSEGSIYTISFVANGGTGTVSSQYGIESSAIELPNNTTAAITKTGYSLGGWSTTIDGTSVIYPLGSIYTVHSDKTFSAVWVADTYVVVFDVNGGT